MLQELWLNGDYYIRTSLAVLCGLRAVYELNRGKSFKQINWEKVLIFFSITVALG